MTEPRTVAPIPALTPRGAGHQFVCYADSCSGVPGAPHEKNLAGINRVVRRLRPQPEFICFPGDEIVGLTADEDKLRRQWRHWLDREMGWLDRDTIPLYHTTGNHTTYDAMSEAVFRETLSHLPRNGPAGQTGLSYFVRREDVLLVFVNTASCELGGEGRVETKWLNETLTAHGDARYKLVLGHHPVFPVNGFAGAYQRDVEPENGREFWDILVRHRVLAYLCSHILAFDVQVHKGVLQILTAGAGTAHRMPEGIEYLHCVQAAIDAQGLRYQVLDEHGVVREWLNWPVPLPDSDQWSSLAPGSHEAPDGTPFVDDSTDARLVVWRFSGKTTADASGRPQTFLCAGDPGPDLSPLWIGLFGPEQRIGVMFTQAAGRSPHLWFGPPLAASEEFEMQIALHTGMGPGGVLWRCDDATPWSTLHGASPWGPERISWPDRWSTGYGQGGVDDRPFRGEALEARWHAESFAK